MGLISGKISMRDSKFRLLLLAMLLASSLVLVLAGCGEEKKEAAQATAPGRAVFSYAEEYDPPSLDPAMIDESVGGNITRYLYDGLVRNDRESDKIAPAVAESWEISEDSLTLTFHLRHGVRFTNGREVNADDFVYAWTRALLMPESPMAGLLSPIEGAMAVQSGEANTLAGVEAVDDYTLKVTLSYPFSDFMNYLDDPVFAPVPREAVEDPNTVFAESPVGNGPFRLKEWVRGERIVLEKNPDYYGKAPALDEVTMKVIALPETALAELKAGNVDAIKKVMPAQIAEVRADGSLKVIEVPVNVIHYAGFNITSEPWQNVKLRQALNYAVDRDTIAGKLLQGLESPADGVIPPSMPGHQDNAMPYTYDPEKAKALLAEAGYPEGQGLPPLVLACMGDGLAPEVAQAMQASFAAIGVEVELQVLEQGVFMEGMQGGDIGFFLISMVAEAPTPDALLYPMFASASIGSYNVYQYQNPEVDRLLEQARQTVDASERTNLYNQAERLILAEAPIIPVTFGRDTVAYLPRVTGITYNAYGDLALDEISVSNS